jgi:hypothetical protein
MRMGHIERSLDSLLLRLVYLLFTVVNGERSIMVIWPEQRTSMVFRVHFSPMRMSFRWFRISTLNRQR